MIKKLLPFIQQPFSNIQHQVTDNYDIAYGDTYSIREIRKACQDRQPAFVKLKEKTFLVVGENPDSLILHNGQKMFNMPDIRLLKSWTGEAVIVQGEKPVKPQRDCNSQFVIFTPERDLWPDEWQDIKLRTNKILSRLELGACWLPPHPVIVTYKQPAEDDIKDFKRAKIHGAEICIYDPLDPVSAFLHEVGHLFWDTQLLDSEKEEIAKLSKGIKINSSAIFIDKFSLEDPNEAFSNVYMWFLKGKLLNEGYLQIVEYQEPEFYKKLTEIIDRIRERKQAEIDWQVNEEKLVAYLAEPKVLRLASGGVIKAHINNGRNFAITNKIYIPDRLYSVDYTDKMSGRSIVTVNEGALQGRQFALHKGKIDFDYNIDLDKYSQPEAPLLKAAKKNVSNLTKKVIINKLGIKQTVYVKAIEEPLPVFKATHTLSDLLKATRNIAKLVKKTIVNKKGHRQTVYVKSGQDLKKEKPAVNGDGKSFKSQVIATALNEQYRKEWQEKNKISLVGKKVTSSMELAYLSQCYRNPQFETFRAFFTSGDRIVAQTGITLRLPGVATPLIDPNDMDVSINYYKGIMERTGADGYFMLHNHPSGEVEPSKEDVNTTEKFYNLLPGCKGHIVINHNKYSTIFKAADGNTMVVADELKSDDKTGDKYIDYLSDDKMGFKIKTPDDLVNFEKAKELRKNDYVVAIGTSKGKTRAVMHIPTKFFEGKNKKCFKEIKNFAVAHGLQDVFVIGLDKEKHLETAKELVQQGYCRDIMVQGEQSENYSLLEYSNMKPLFDTRFGEHFSNYKPDVIQKAFGHKDVAKLQKKEIINKKGKMQTVYVNPEQAVEGIHAAGGLQNMIKNMPTDSVYRLLHMVVNDKKHKWYGNQKVIKILADHLHKKGTISQAGLAVVNSIGKEHPDSVKRRLWSLGDTGGGNALGNKILHHIVSSYVSQGSAVRKAIDYFKFNLLLLKSSLNEARDNTETNPTDAKIEAGNYKKGKISWNGLTISLENPKGSYRHGMDKTGGYWESQLQHDYGYINGTEGEDGDQVDVFLNEGFEDGDTVYIVNQIDPDNGMFDEHKCMIGFDSIAEAKEAYLSNYEKGWKGFGDMVGMPVDDFKKWLLSATKK